MKHECETAEHAIWECARAGRELPADTQRHIDECPECARAADEANRILGLMSEVGSVPASPDCREAVMARISRPRRRPVWAYAFAALLLAAVIVSGFYLFQGGRPSPQVARNVPTITQGEPEMQVQERVPQVAAPEPQKVEAPEVVVRKREPRKYRTPSHKRRVPAPRPVVVPEKPAVAQETPGEPAEDDWPVVIVAVTWEAAPSESQDSYAYVQTDPETGETTTCRVQRSDGSVNIFLESKPGGDEPSEKGA